MLSGTVRIRKLTIRVLHCSPLKKAIKAALKKNSVQDIQGLMGAS
jgi:hypothetical protein